MDNLMFLDSEKAPAIIFERARLQRGAKGIDITVKSAKGDARLLAPTWEMVNKLKWGKLSQNCYVEMYREILDSHINEIVKYLLALSIEQGPKITFLCYCKDGEFCHTHIAANWAWYVMGNRGVYTVRGKSIERVSWTQNMLIRSVHDDGIIC